MRIQFNTDKTIEGDLDQENYFTGLIAEGLKRHKSQISRIEVHLSDENGKKDGLNDMRCLLEARIEGRQPIAVTNQADTVALAVTGAIDKLASLVDTIFSKKLNH